MEFTGNNLDQEGEGDANKEGKQSPSGKARQRAIYTDGF